METFEEVLEQYAGMITAVMRKASIYKNHEHFRQSATIALWQAWTNYNPEQGHFAPYAYRTMLTTMYKEIHRENRHTERFVAYEKDKLGDLAQYYELKHQTHQEFPQLDYLLDNLIEAERQLLIDLYIHQLTFEQLSARYGVKVPTLKKRRDRLLKRLRQQTHSKENF